VIRFAHRRRRRRRVWRRVWRREKMKGMKKVK